MDEAKWESLGTEAMHQADKVGALVEEAGRVFGSDPEHAARVARFAAWIFGEGAQWTLDLCRKAQRVGGKDRFNIDPERIKLDKW